MEIPKEISNAIDSHLITEEIKEMQEMTREQWLQWHCDRMNKGLSPEFQRDFVCEKCHNAGIYYIVMNNDIVGVICDCWKNSEYDFEEEKWEK